VSSSVYVSPANSTFPSLDSSESISFVLNVSSSRYARIVSRKFLANFTIIRPNQTFIQHAIKRFHEWNLSLLSYSKTQLWTRNGEIVDETRPNRKSVNKKWSKNCNLFILLHIINMPYKILLLYEKEEKLQLQTVRSNYFSHFAVNRVPFLLFIRDWCYRFRPSIRDVSYERNKHGNISIKRSSGRVFQFEYDYHMYRYRFIIYCCTIDLYRD